MNHLARFFFGRVPPPCLGRINHARKQCLLRNKSPSCIRLIMKLLTTKQAAAVLGVSDRRVRAMIHEGQLPAHHLGRDYAIEEKTLQAVAKIERRPGRPPKSVAGRRGASRKATTKS